MVDIFGLLISFQGIHVHFLCYRDDPYFIKGEEAFRAFCLKLAVTASYLRPLPQNSTFRVQIHTTETASVSLAEDPRHQVHLILTQFNKPTLCSRIFLEKVIDPQLVKNFPAFCHIHASPALISVLSQIIQSVPF
jgi:hypothetical protein